MKCTLCKTTRIGLLDEYEVFLTDVRSFLLNKQRFVDFTLRQKKHFVLIDGRIFKRS